MSEQTDYVEAVRRFGDVAGRFCAIVDEAEASERTALLFRLYRILPEMIEEAIQLPVVCYDDAEKENPEEETRNRSLEAKAQMSQESWGQIYEALKVKVGDWDHYWMVFNPTEDSDAIDGSLADDIADIYRDLKEGNLLATTDKYPARDILFEWRYGFETHWGKHALDALRTIHTLASQIEG